MADNRKAEQSKAELFCFILLSFQPGNILDLEILVAFWKALHAKNSYQKENTHWV